jgi:hypothetical protein
MPSFLSSRLREIDRWLLRAVTGNRSSLSTLSTLLQIQPPSTSRTTSMSGQPTTTALHHTCLTRYATRAPLNGARFSPPTSRTVRRHQTCPTSWTYPRRRVSVSLLLSKRPYTPGALRRMPSGHCGDCARRARTFRRGFPSPSLTMLATPAVAWLRSIASSLPWGCSCRWLFTE